MHRFLSPILSCLVICARSVAADNPAAAKALELDTFPGGPWTGMNAVFQSKNFDATLDKDRVLRIQPKDDGKNVGVPVLVRFSTYYVIDQRSIPRDMVSIEKKPAPSMQPKKIEIAGTCEQKIKFDVSFHFSERGVTVDGTVKDPQGIKYPSTFAYAAYFTASHQIPKDTPLDEVKSQTAGFTVKFTNAAKQAETMQFWEISQNRSGTVASGEVTGPWGPRRVIAEMPAVRASGARIGTFGNYAVLPFYKGGWYFSRGGTHKVPAGPLTVRVE